MGQQNDNELIRPHTIKIKKILWDKFKDKVPRTLTLNDQIVELIEKFVEGKK